MSVETERQTIPAPRDNPDLIGQEAAEAVLQQAADSGPEPARDPCRRSRPFRKEDQYIAFVAQ